MTDLLRMDHINSLPQPFIANLFGKSRWPIYDIDVQTGLLRVDVCGKLECMHIGDVVSFEDADGNIHDAETFYSDYLESPKLSDYGCLVDDYDVASVEDEHMQAAIQYGWHEF